MHSRRLMIKLGIDEDTLKIYQELKKEHLKAETFILDPSLRNTRYEHLPWFWSMDKGKADEDKWLTECMYFYSWLFRSYLYLFIVYRVHWLRAKSRYDRWVEESVLVSAEMEWTLKYFEHQADIWKVREKTSKEHSSQGHSIYAARQCAMWLKFHLQADKIFQGVKSTIS